MSSIFKLLKLKDYITLIGTVSGLIALVCAVLGGPENSIGRAYLSLGFFMIVISIGTDTFDGYVARKTGTVNEIGKELDSLSDCLTFGIAPALLMYQAFRTNTIYDFVLAIGCICFALGALLRLARFNISDSPGYTGVPTPLSALAMIVYFYWNYFYAYALGGAGNSGLRYSFPQISKIIIPFVMISIGWFNITTHISFGEKGKTVYMMFIIFGLLTPVLGILGLLSHDVLADFAFEIAIICFVFFLGAFLLEMGYLVLSLFLKPKEPKKESKN